MKVPVYDNLQTQVSSQSGPSVQAPGGPTPGSIAAEQIGRFGQAVSGVGSALDKMAQAEQDKADDFRVSDAINKTLAKRIDLTHNKDYGFTLKQGEAALKPDPDGKGLVESYGEKFSTTIDELAGSLGNERQRQAYRLRADQMRAQFEGEIQTHMGRENKQFQISVVAGTVKNNQESAALNWYDQKARSEALANIAAAIDKNPTGKSPEELKADKVAQLSVANIAIITNATAPGPARDLTFARGYFAENKASMTEGDREKASKMLEASSVAQAGIDGAEAIMAKLGPRKDGDPWQQDVYEKAAREMFRDDPEKYKAVVGELTHKGTVYQHSVSQRSTAGMNEAIAMANKGVSLKNIQATPQYLAMTPAAQQAFTRDVTDRSHSMWARSIEDKLRIDADIARRNNAAYLTYSDPETLSKMSTAEINALQPFIGITHTNQLMARKQSLGTKNEHLPEAKIDADDFKVIAKRMGLDAYSPKTDEEKAALGSLQSKVERVLTIEQQRKGKPLTREEKQAFVRREIATTVTVQGGWFTSNKEVPVIMLSAEQKAAVAVPMEEQKVLRAQMAEARAREPNNPMYLDTPENVQQLYLIKKSETAGMVEAARK